MFLFSLHCLFVFCLFFFFFFLCIHIHLRTCICWPSDWPGLYITPFLFFFFFFSLLCHPECLDSDNMPLIVGARLECVFGTCMLFSRTLLVVLAIAWHPDGVFLIPDVYLLNYFVKLIMTRPSLAGVFRFGDGWREREGDRKRESERERVLMESWVMVDYCETTSFHVRLIFINCNFSKFVNTIFRKSGSSTKTRFFFVTLCCSRNLRKLVVYENLPFYSTFIRKFLMNVLIMLSFGE